MRVLELRGELNLEPEAIGLHLGCNFRREHLDCDDASESPVLRYKDATHPAAVKLAVERVGVAQRCAQSVDQLRQAAAPKSGGIPIRLRHRARPESVSLACG